MMDYLNKVFVDMAIKMDDETLRKLPPTIRDKIVLKAVEKKMSLDDFDARNESFKVSLKTKTAGITEIDEKTIMDQRASMRADYFTQCKKGNTTKEKAAFIMPHGDCDGYADKMATAWFTAYVSAVGENKKKLNSEKASISY